MKGVSTKIKTSVDHFLPKTKMSFHFKVTSLFKNWIKTGTTDSWLLWLSPLWKKVLNSIEGRKKEPSNYISPLISNCQKQKVTGIKIKISCYSFDLHETFKWQGREKGIIDKQKPLTSDAESYIYIFFLPSLIK